MRSTDTPSAGGLLDFLNTDDARLGIGLLGASGWMPGNVGAGQRMQMALGGMDEYKQNKQRSALGDMQIENYKSEIEARKLAAQKYIDLKTMSDRFYGSNGAQTAQPGQLGSGTFGVMPTANGMDAFPAQRPAGLAGKTIDEITQFHAAGGPDLLPAYKLAREGFERKPGSFYEGIDGKREYVGDPTKGIGFNNGRINLMPGAENLAFLEGQKALATQMPKSLLDAAGKINLRKNPDGTESPVPELNENPTLQNLLRNLGGNQPSPVGTAPTAPPSIGMPSRNPMAARAGDSDQSAIFGQELTSARGRLAMAVAPEEKARAQADIDGISREMSRLKLPMGGVSASPAYGMTNDQLAQAKANEARIVGTATADVQSTQGRQAAMDSAMNAYSLVDKAIAHPGLPMATGLQGKLDPRNYIPGTDASNFDALAKQLQGNAFLSAFASLKGAGQITEAEGAKATSAIARLQQSQSTAEYKAALKDYQDVIGQGLKRMGVDPSSIGKGATGDWNEKPNAKVIDSLPTPNSGNRGQRIRDTTTGKILVSNGLQWKAE